MRVYLIAGEASGDLLGARLMQQMPGTEFTGIGGPLMQEQGLQSLFPMAELSLMGFVEIIPHIPRLKRRIRETTADILSQKPDVLLTIDSPGFNFRVAKALRAHWPKDAPDSPVFIHYVAPSVWAYKPGRARKLSQIYDRVLTLLPFEPPYFEREGMKADFVGHPLVETPARGDAVAFRTQHGLAEDTRLLTVLPGSRMGELTRHLPILRDTVREVAKRHQGLVTLMPAVPHLKDAVERMTRDWPTPILFTGQGAEKWDAFAASDAAIAKSGTVTLELALARTPMVVMYKVHPLSAWLMRKMKLTRYVTLVNILLEKEAVPELLQEDATPPRILSNLLALLEDAAARQEQIGAFDSALRMLGLGNPLHPSEKAAKILRDSVA